MTEPYRVYDLIDSPFCLKVRICLSLKGVPYRRIGVTLRRLSELRRLNPLAKVPVLIVNGRPMADSSAIARFLEEKVPRPRLLPKDTVERAFCHLLEDWADESLYFIVGAFKWLNPSNRSRAYVASAELASSFLPRNASLYLVRRRITRRYRSAGYPESALPQLEQQMTENLTALRDLLADKPFLLGRYATLADISVFAQLYWLSQYEEKRLLDAVPTVQRWIDSLAGLDEIQQAIRAESPPIDAREESASSRA